MEKHALHLKTPELQKSDEVQDAVEKQERLTHEKIPNDPNERIEAYTNRLEKVFLNEDEKVRERNINMLRPKIYDALIIKKTKFPESYFELQQRIARERGQAVEEIPKDVREQMMDVAIEDQKASLDAWIDYLSSNDAVYPAWFKYYVWTQITKLSQFDKERGEFKKRTDSTVAPFPDIYREPLAQIADIYEKVRADNKNLKDPEIQEAFSKKFPALYAELIQKSLAASMENREEIKGEWVKYDKGVEGNAEKLFQSLEEKGTGWCTAGQETAKKQIESGDFYVYYTYDKDGIPSQPRLAIRMVGDQIGEVRGILQHQGVEPQMNDILENKLSEFGSEADKYKKKSEDMKFLTAIWKKTEGNISLNKDELRFLYEVDSDIEGFGYKKDPRIAEIIKKRDLREDLSIALGIRTDQISTGSADFNQDTVVYIYSHDQRYIESNPDNSSIFQDTKRALKIKDKIAVEGLKLAPDEIKFIYQSQINSDVALFSTIITLDKVRQIHFQAQLVSYLNYPEKYLAVGSAKITENTRAVVLNENDWTPKVLQDLPSSVEYVYEVPKPEYLYNNPSPSDLESTKCFFRVNTGLTKSGEDALQKLDEAGIVLPDDVLDHSSKDALRQLVQKDIFLTEPQTFLLASFSPEQLGFDDGDSFEGEDYYGARTVEIEQFWSRVAEFHLQPASLQLISELALNDKISGQTIAFDTTEDIEIGFSRDRYLKISSPDFEEDMDRRIDIYDNRSGHIGMEMHIFFTKKI